MKITKKILISSMLLVLIATPILANVTVTVNTDLSSQQVSEKNSIGTVILKHQPFLKTIFTDKGLITEYEPPEDNPNYEYFFPEDENGNVYLNFTLKVKHLLNPIPIYWAKLLWPENHRWTGLTVWINYWDFYANSIVICNTSTFKEYTISFSDGMPFFTNGSTLRCTLWCIAYPCITPNSQIQELCGNVGRFHIFDQVIVTNISIIPY